ncbi:MAG: PAS domain S-box protein [Cyanobacteria bacterium J06638_22]
MAQLLQVLTTSIGESEDFDAALKAVLEQVCELADWDMGEVWVPSQGDQHLHPNPVWYAKVPEHWASFRAATMGLWLQPGQGLPGRVWQSGMPEWVPDVSQSPHSTFARWQGALSAGVRAGLAVPIVSGDLPQTTDRTATSKTHREQVVAVLAFFRFESWTEDARRVGLVTAIAAQLGPIIRLKQAQTHLAASRDHFHHLIDSLPGIVFSSINDIGWSMQYLSAGCALLTGYRSEDLAGEQRILTFNDIVHPDDLPHVLQTISEAIAQRQPYVVEYRIRTRQGEEKWLWEKGYGVFDATGQVKGVEGFITDTTDRKQMENSLRNNERLFRSLFDWAAMGICLNDREGRLQDCNTAFEEFLGYSLSEMYRRHFHNWTYPDDLAEDMGLLEEIMEGDRDSFHLEKRYIRKDGQIVWGKLTISAIRDEYGDVTATFGFVENISQRKHAEAALRAQEEQSRQLLQAIPELLFVIDDAGVYRYVQAEDEADLLYPPEDILGKSPEQLLPPPLAQQLRQKMQQARETGHYQAIDYQLSFDAEVRYFEGRVAPYGEASYVLTVRNISNRKRAERAIQEQEAFLRLVLDAIPQHIFWKDTNLVYRGGNHAFAQAAGLANPEALIGKTDLDLWESEQADDQIARDRQLLETQQPTRNVVQQRQLGDGHLVWQVTNQVPIYDADNEIVGILGTYDDITEQKRIAALLTRRQQYLNALVDLQNALLATDELSKVADAALASLGTVAGASRAYLFENFWTDTGELRSRHRHEWCAEGIASRLDNPAFQILNYEAFPHLHQRLLSNESYMATVAKLPDSERTLLESQGVVSLLLLPLWVNEHHWGFIGFDNCVETQLWLATEVDLLRAAAASISLSLERQQASAAVRDSEARYRLLADNSNDVIACHSPEGIFRYVSPACLALLGYTPDELQGRSLFDLIHPDDTATVQRIHKVITRTEQFDITPYSYRVRHKLGHYLWMETCSRAVKGTDFEDVEEIIAVSRDVTERYRASELLTGQKRLLEMIARDYPLQDTLEELLRTIQAQKPESLPSILMVNAEETQVQRGISLALPKTYMDSLQGLVIGPRVGTCGTAMHFGKIVITSDIQVDPLWEGFRELALPYGLRSCWSMPIISSQGRILGSFATYHREPQSPTSHEIQLLEIARQIAAIAIEQELASEALQQAEARYRGIFENAVEGIFQSTVDGRYTIVNPMLASIYGYDSPDDLMQSLTDISQQVYVSAQRRLEFTQEMTTQGMVQGFESQVYRKDGSIIWISECARALLNEDGEIVGYEGTVEDITLRKQVEAELLKRDALLLGVASATHELLTEAVFDKAIQNVLQILGQAARADRTYIYQNHPHSSTGAVAMSIRHEWTDLDIAPTLFCDHWHDLPYYQAGLGRWYEAFQGGRSFSGISRLMSPAEQAILGRDQIRSIIMVPIQIDQELWGYIGFDDCHTEREWTASEESMLVAIAASIGAALRRQRTDAQMRYQAFHDALTGLPNRNLYDHRLSLTLAQARREKETVGVMFLDLDRFKTINDTLGHAVGDQLLKLITQRLIPCLREEDTMARWGGDEFTLLLPALKSPENAAKIAQCIAQALKPAFRLNGHDLHITCSLGIAIYPQDGSDPDTLLKNADVALYRAKEQGRNNYQFYTSALNSRASERLTLDHSLHKALERDELVLYYQPQCDLSTGKIQQIEALIRWQHPRLGLLSPHMFIPLAEENGLIRPIGDWVLETACRQLQKWHQMGLSDLKLAVNLSATQFQQLDLVESIAHCLNTLDLDPQLLELEITETTFMKDMEFTQRLLHLLREMGICIALDDFGTGYSSMNYLRELPLNTLKIDRSFVSDISTCSRAAAIIATIITLGHGLGLNVVAEGVETQEQQEQLRSLNCSSMQGFLFSGPLATEETTQFLLSHQPLPVPLHPPS